MIDESDWGAWDAPLTEEVRLPSTGRPAVLHKSLRVSDVVRRGMWSDAIPEWLAAQVGDGTIDPARAVEARDRVVVCAFVRPRLVLTEDEAGDGAIPISRLTDDEIDDVVTFALGGREFMEAFRRALADAAPALAGDGRAPVAAAPRRAPGRAGRRGSAAGTRGAA